MVAGEFPLLGQVIRSRDGVQTAGASTGAELSRVCEGPARPRRRWAARPSRSSTWTRARRQRRAKAVCCFDGHCGEHKAADLSGLPASCAQGSGTEMADWRGAGREERRAGPWPHCRPVTPVVSAPASPSRAVSRTKSAGDAAAAGPRPGCAGPGSHHARRQRRPTGSSWNCRGSGVLRRRARPVRLASRARAPQIDASPSRERTHAGS